MNTLSGTEKRLVTLIDRHASQLNELTTHLLRTARLDSTDLKLQREPIDLTQLIQGSIEAHTSDQGEHSIVARPTIEPHRTVWADPQLLKMALFQLFDNAIKYSPPGSPIAVDIREEQAEILISVRNEGSFIPPEDEPGYFSVSTAARVRIAETSRT